MKRSFGWTASPIAPVIAVAAIIMTACTGGQGVPSSTPASTPQAPATAASSMAAPSALASTSPSPTAAPLIWTKASLTEDWPAPVRTEPAGPATIVPISLQGDYPDPTGDTESDAFPWVDIHLVGFGHNNSVVAYVPGAPEVDPTEQWIAYGVVVDDDGDGIADRRLGMDNLPGPATELPHRAWITDLHTGRTESSVLNSLDYFESPKGIVKTPNVGDTSFGTFFPAAPTEASDGPSCSPARRSGPSHPYGNPPIRMRGLAGAQLMFGGGGDVAGSSPSRGDVLARTLARLPARYYVWASVIVDGRVAATDYAPDSGWLHPSSKEPPIAVEDEVAPPIDSLDEALAAVGQSNPYLSGFQASDTHVPGASAWLEAAARGDGWDITFVCGDSPGGEVSHATAKLHVSRDGTVDEICIWQDPSGDTGVPGYSAPPESENAAGPCKAA